MRIQQEIWSPDKGWLTINNNGSILQASIVFCQGNSGSYIPRSLFREIKHAFPNAPILFTFSEKAKETNLYLTALSFEHTSFSLFQYNLEREYMELVHQHNKSGDKTDVISQLLVCSALSPESETQLAEQLLKEFAFDKIEKPISNDEYNSFIGLNQLPSTKNAIGIAFHDTNLNIQSNINTTKKSSGSGPVAVQALPIPASLQFIEMGDNKPASIPITYTFLLKR